MRVRSLLIFGKGSPVCFCQGSHSSSAKMVSLWIAVSPPVPASGFSALSSHFPLCVFWGTVELLMGIWHGQDYSVMLISNPEYEALRAFSHGSAGPAWLRAMWSWVPAPPEWPVGVREHYLPLPLLRGDCCHSAMAGGMEPASGKLPETLQWKKDCLFQGGRPSHVFLGTHWCQTSGGSRKQFSHPVQFPKVWKAMMVCKRRVLQFYLVCYLLVVSCAADRSPFSPQEPLVPSHCTAGEVPWTVLGLPHCKSSLICLCGWK